MKDEDSRDSSDNSSDKLMSSLSGVNQKPQKKIEEKDLEKNSNNKTFVKSSFILKAPEEQRKGNPTHTRENLAEILRSQTDVPQPKESFSPNASRIDTYIAGVIMSPRREKKLDHKSPTGTQNPFSKIFEQKSAKFISSSEMNLKKVAQTPKTFKNLQNLTPRQPSINNIQQGIELPLESSKNLPTSFTEKLKKNYSNQADQTTPKTVSFAKRKSISQIPQPCRNQERNTIANILLKTFGYPRSVSASPILSIDVAPPLTPIIPEDKSAFYYDRLDSRMNEAEDPELFKYLFYCPDSESLEKLKAKQEESKTLSKDLKTQLLSKRPKMVFAELLKDFAQSKVLPILKIRKDSNPVNKGALSESKVMDGGKATEYDPMFDNLEQTGANFIGNYLKNCMEEEASPMAGSVPYPFMMLSNFLMKRDSGQKSVAMSTNMIGSMVKSVIDKKQRPKLSNLEEHINRKREILKKLRNCISFQKTQRRDFRNQDDLCHIEQSKLSASNFGKLVCAQYFHISTSSSSGYEGHDVYQFDQSSHQQENDAANNPGTPMTTTKLAYTQKIMVAKFSPDTFSLALGCSDGFVVILQYNNENTKWDLFQSESLVLGRTATKGEMSPPVVDLAWSMVDIDYSEFRVYSGVIP